MVQQKMTSAPRAAIGRAERRSDEIYRHYRLVAGQRGERFAAVAYAGKVQVFTTTGESLDEATGSLRQMIDNDIKHRADRRGVDRPSSLDFERALDLIGSRRTVVQHHLLERIMILGGETTSLEQLRTRSDFSHDALLRALARLARHIAAILDISLPKGPASGAVSMKLLIDTGGAKLDLDAEWTLQPEFVAAVRRHMAK